MQILKVSKAANISEGKAADLMFDGFRDVMRGALAPYPVRGGLAVRIKPRIDGEYMVELIASGTVIAAAICDQFDK